MSVSLREVIESAGHDLSTVEGAKWLLAQEDLMEELVNDAEEVIEEEERLTAIRDAEEAEEERIAEREYNEKFPPEEKE